MAVLALKLLLAPALVVGASLAGRRWGSRAAGLLGSLPIVAGPILLALAVEQGDAFAARAATGTLVALVAVVAFMLTLAATSARLSPAGALLTGWGAFLAVGVSLAALELGGLAAAAAAVGALVAGALALPRPGDRGVPVPLPAWDLPLRAAVAAGLVLTVAALADAAGPRLSGVLALSPVSISVLAGFELVAGGRDAMLGLLRGVIVGLLAVLGFAGVLAAALGPWGIVPAFAAAAAVAVLPQAMVAAGALRSR